ncbi:response regulator [Kamptonema formosum]|uniref:response regulator n=1 Tax=Kamptonema formosum TaxID=331992 RepID=UPI0018E1FDEF|nr:response regulator [Oscillatoria sp. PCC 10802]
MNSPFIICVDDDATILDSLKIELEAAFGDECSLEIAEGGNEALEVISELLQDECEVAVVIADYIMRDMKGDEFLKRAHEMSPKTRTVMLTGQADISGVANAINYGKLYRYMAKPWQAEDLRLTVREALQSYLQEKELAEKNSQLLQLNRALEHANREQAALIAQLAEAEKKLKDYSRTLETQVAERTEALRRSEAQLNAFFTSAPVGLCVADRQMRFRQINQVLAQIGGLSAEEHIGKTIREVLPELAPALEPLYEKALSEKKTILNVEISCNISNQQGFRRYWLVSCFPIPDSEELPSSVGAVVMEISDRKQVELALQERESVLRSLGDRLPKGFIYQLVQEPSGRIYFSYISAGVERLFGIAPETVMQEPALLYASLVEGDRLLLQQLLAESAGTLAGFEMQLRKRTERGDLQWLQLRCAPRRLPDGGTVWDGIEIDITELKQTEVELAAAKEAAEAASTAKSQFLANMSHELRTPLNAILGFTQVMSADKSLSPKNQQQLKIINGAGSHLLELINDILEMSKIEAGKSPLHESSFDLIALLDSLKQMLQLKAEAKGLQLSFETDKNLPQFVRSDEGKLRQVLINILGNAIKFTQEGSVTLRVRVGDSAWGVGHQASDTEQNNQFSIPNPKSPMPRAQCPAPNAPRPIIFEVSDTGPGIALEEMDKLFESFAQTETGWKSQQGTGLGLPISRKFVRLMGGDIAASSAVSRGSTFTFDIQVKPADSTEIQAQLPHRKILHLAPNQPQYRILAVDDRPESRLLLAHILTSAGFQMREAENGKEAIEVWESWQPHLILMDMRMPVMDGYEATKQIKSHLRGEPAAIIALTASVFERERSEILAAGCDDFIRKPFQRDHLLQKVGQHLGVLYIYEEESSNIKAGKPNTEAIPTPADLSPHLAQMSPEWVGEVSQAARYGSDDIILKLLEDIPPEHAPLAITLADLANNFEFEKILKLLKK